MFSGLSDAQSEMLKEIDDSKTQATSVVTQAQQTAASLQAKQHEGLDAIAKIPSLIGGWGIVWAAGIYYFILRPLIK